MKRCLRCSRAYEGEQNTCPSCGYAATEVAGIVRWQGPVEQGEQGFKSEYFENLASREAGSFWFVGRNRIITWLLRRYAKGFRSFLEVGCGTGFVLTGIARAFGDVQLTGSELYGEGLVHAARRLPGAAFMQFDARDIPFVEEFDAIGAFDVIEHISEDEEVLRQMYAALKDGGHLFITVPQHKWLWSQTDDHACHKRRYTGRELRTKVSEAGFRIRRSGSFVSFLLPLMWLSRSRIKQAQGAEEKIQAELRLPGWQEKILGFILFIEFLFIAIGINFPFGGSRFLVAVKPLPRH